MLCHQLDHRNHDSVIPHGAWLGQSRRKLALAHIALSFGAVRCEASGRLVIRAKSAFRRSRPQSGAQRPHGLGTPASVSDGFLWMQWDFADPSAHRSAASASEIAVSPTRGGGF